MCFLCKSKYSAREIIQHSVTLSRHSDWCEHCLSPFPIFAAPPLSIRLRQFPMGGAKVRIQFYSLFPRASRCFFYIFVTFTFSIFDSESDGVGSAYSELDDYDAPAARKRKGLSIKIFLKNTWTQLCKCLKFGRLSKNLLTLLKYSIATTHFSWRSVRKGQGWYLFRSKSRYLQNLTGFPQTWCLWYRTSRDWCLRFAGYWCWCTAQRKEYRHTTCCTKEYNNTTRYSSGSNAFFCFCQIVFWSEFKCKKIIYRPFESKAFHCTT